MKYNKIKTGERLSTTMYLEVVGQLPQTSTLAEGIKVKDSNGKTFDMRGKTLIENSLNSGSQYSTEKKVSRTEMAHILTNAGDSVFTAVFEKVGGEMRTLTGRLLESENLMGRSNVEDLELPTTEKNKLRQVDHRTLQSLILKDVKYVIK